MSDTTMNVCGRPKVLAFVTNGVFLTYFLVSTLFLIRDIHEQQFDSIQIGMQVFLFISWIVHLVLLAILGYYSIENLKRNNVSDELYVHTKTFRFMLAVIAVLVFDNFFGALFIHNAITTNYGGLFWIPALLLAFLCYSLLAMAIIICTFALFGYLFYGVGLYFCQCSFLCRPTLPSTTPNSSSQFVSVIVVPRSAV